MLNPQQQESRFRTRCDSIAPAGYSDVFKNGPYSNDGPDRCREVL
jgi:hypothetical protein